MNVIDPNIKLTCSKEGVFTIPDNLVHPQTEFGWEFCEYQDFASRLCWAELQACYHDGVSANGEPVLGDWHLMIEKALKTHFTDIKEVNHYLSTGADWEFEQKQPKCYTNGYIDHQSIDTENGDGIFDNDDTVYHFIFGKDSAIMGGNDNVDEDPSRYVW
jgi:hypothetical protein